MRGTIPQTDLPANVSAAPLPLSVIIITLNEAANLAECLDSLAGIAAEIVIVDSGSADGTIELARARGARLIVNTPWPGFGPQKNIALDAASCDWILSLDADERLTEELRRQIHSAIAEAKFDAYEMPRLSYFCGQPVRHCGWYPDYIVRLVRRGTARFSDKLVHESLIPQGAVGRLTSPLVHYSYRSHADVERKVESYSEAGARQMFKQGKKTSHASALVHGIWAFIRTYFLKGGFLDGVTGWRVADMNRRASYLKYVKLVGLWRRS